MRLPVQIRKVNKNWRLNLEKWWRRKAIFLNKCSILMRLTSSRRRCPGERKSPRMKLLCKTKGLWRTGYSCCLILMLQEILCWSPCLCTILTMPGSWSNRNSSSLKLKVFWSSTVRHGLLGNILWMDFWSFLAPLWSPTWLRTRCSWKRHLAVTLSLLPLWLLNFPLSNWSSCHPAPHLWPSLCISQSL